MIEKKMIGKKSDKYDKNDFFKKKGEGKIFWWRIFSLFSTIIFEKFYPTFIFDLFTYF